MTWVGDVSGATNTDVTGYLRSLAISGAAGVSGGESSEATTESGGGDSTSEQQQAEENNNDNGQEAEDSFIPSENSMIAKVQTVAKSQLGPDDELKAFVNFGIPGEAYFLSGDQLHRVPSCDVCGPAFDFCEAKALDPNYEKPPNIAHVVLTTDDFVAEQVFPDDYQCYMLPQLLSLIPKGSFAWFHEQPSDLFFVTQDNTKTSLPVCHECSPRNEFGACRNGGAPHFVDMDVKSQMVTLVPKAYVDAYLPGPEFSCDMVQPLTERLPKFDNIFLHVNEGGTEKYYFSKQGNIHPVDSCQPCPESPHTHCPSPGVNEVYVMPNVKLSSEQLAQTGLQKSGEGFNCGMMPLMQKFRAALFSPYHITPGGGEKYLLESARAFQVMGYAVDLFTEPYNVCNTTQCILDVGNALNVDLDPTQFRYMFKQGDRDAAFTIMEEAKYDIFFLIGNEKIPQFKGIGRYNIFQCQFPFDLAKGEVDDQSLLMLSGYDVVWVNSQFTRNWYLNYTHPWSETLRKQNLEPMNSELVNWNKGSYHQGCSQWRSFRWPQVDIMFPPARVTKLQSETAGRDPNECSLIVLLGRVFQGRQAKGHSLAIEMLNLMRQEYPDMCMNLALAGHVMPGHEDYAEGLQLLGESQKVEMHFSAGESEVYDLLRRATVQWHLTGALNDEHDPASFEHFGISIVEGMSKGAIPVVLNQGGPAEIVTKDVGKAVDNVKDFIKATVDILTMLPGEREAMSNKAKARARDFSEEKFREKADYRIHRGQLEQGVLEILPEFSKLDPKPFPPPKKGQKCSKKYECAALMVEFRDHPLFAVTVRNWMKRLGPNWKLHIVTLPGTAANMIEALNAAMPEKTKPKKSDGKGLMNLAGASENGRVAVWAMEGSITMNTDTYSTLFKKPSFWDYFKQHYGVLVFQVDAIMVENSKMSIYDFVKYDYAGAPWCKDNDVLKPLVDKGIIKYFVGNGGFSWRTVKSMKECAKSMKDDFDLLEPEDRLFIRCYSKHYGDYSVSPWEESKLFSVEVPCWDFQQSYDSGNLPLALHATWYYAQKDLVRNILGIPPLKEECRSPSYL